MLQAELPDITTDTQSDTPLPLDGVGMQQIDLMLPLLDNGDQQQLPAKASIEINLPASGVRGIHMSRLYRLLYDYTGQQLCSPMSLQTLLQQMLVSHQDCQSDQVQLCLAFDYLCQRPALKTPGLAGWRRYPVQLQAQLAPDGFQLRLQVDVQYSSTCPCSAALSRQLLQQKFLADFAGEQLAKAEVASWLLEHGSFATPHSQRSVASIEVTIPATAESFAIRSLLDITEYSLATPVQTAVKRADEQEFARLNGANLMFVEDAARRLEASLSQHYRNVAIKVAHLESLHPHDAVARVHMKES